MEEKRLVRVHEKKVIGGVCTGLARYFNIDVSKVRLAWVLFSLFGGSGILIYLVLWLILPLRIE